MSPAAGAVLPLVLLLCLAGTGPSSEGPLTRAQEALAAGQASAALTSLEEALRRDPENTGALLLLGQAMMQLGRFEDAVPPFRRAAELLGTSPTGLDASCVLADALTRLGRSREAIGVLNGVLEAAPKRPSVRHDLGRIYLVVGELEAAARSFRDEIDLPADPKAPPSPEMVASCHEGLGLAAYRLGDDAAALAALEKAPKTIEARYHAGLALSRTGRHEEALEEFEAILARETDHRGALQGLARAAGSLGRSDVRTKALDRFGQLYRQDEAQRARRVKLLDLRTRAESLAREGKLAEASAKLDEAARLAPDDLEIAMDRGRLMYASGNLAEAEKAFTLALAQPRLNAEARYRIGRMQADRGEIAGAIASLQEACRTSPMTLSYRVLLAQLSMRAGRAEDGVREMRFAKRLSPDDPDGPFNLGLALAQAGSWREAATELEAAVSLGYTDPRVHQALAQVYARLGETEKSRREQQAFERLTSSPGDPR